MADKFEKKSYWAKGIICCLFQALSIPLLCLTCSGISFWPSLIAYAFYHVVASTYVGPGMAMMQNTAPANLQGNCVSVYFFSITIAQTIAPSIFGMLAKSVGAFTNPMLYGPLISAFTVISYGLSIPFWYKAGKHYKDFMVEKDSRMVDPVI